MGKSAESLTADPVGPVPLRRGDATSPTGTPTVPAGAPDGALAALLAEVLAEVVQAEDVQPDSHFFDDLGADSMVMAKFCARVRKHPDLPNVSIKDVYQNPTIRRLASTIASPAAPVAPSTAPSAPVAPVAPSRPSAVEQSLATVLAGVLKVDDVPADSHFFDDLGADSMLMAQFCARVRKHPDLPNASMKDVYAHPTIAALALALVPRQPTPPATVTATATATAAAAAPVEPADTSPAVPPLPVARASTRAYVLTGVAQFLIFLGYAYLTGVVFSRGFDWVNAAVGVVEVYLRAVVFGVLLFLGTATIPIAAKWLLVGRWTRRQIQVWSPGYLRFWLVRTLTAANPMVLFAGTPLYNLYLRALGAKVGRGAVVFTRHVPVATDLLTIGSGTVILKDSFLACYRAQSGVIHTGAVTLGRDVFLGERAVLDIETVMGDGSQLGHASSLHAGQSVPVGAHWHGSPAEPTTSDYRGGLPPGHCGTARRAWYSVMQLLVMLLVYLPLAAGGLALAFHLVPWLEQLLEPSSVTYRTGTFYVVALATSAALFFGFLLVGLLVVTTVPRLLNLAIRPDTVYPLYGFRFSVHRTIARMTNRKFFHKMTGDSSLIPHYLRAVGWRLSPLVQTGSNFGSEVKHETPFLSRVGRGTVIASDISMSNAQYSSTSFRVSESAIGAENFFGNQIVYPSGGRTGNDCLLGTKVLVPIEGPVREGVGLLGSPAFEIPRSVSRDTRFYHLASGENLRRGLVAKNRHNAITLASYLLARWVYVFVVTVLGLFVADHRFDPLLMAGTEMVMLAFSFVYFATLERASTGFRGVRPLYCSIYTVDFWRIERFFKFQAAVTVHRLTTGTPFKAWLYRFVGVKVGRRLFDDGSGMSEKNLVSIGDDVTLGAGSFIQCHSQEDYAFKSAPIHIGSGCTVGIAAMVHYGTTMGDGSTLAPDTFLMKGEEVPENDFWGGNPARELTDDLPALYAGARPGLTATGRRPAAHARDARSGRYVDAYVRQLHDEEPQQPSGLYFDQWFERHFEHRDQKNTDRAAAGDRSHA